MGYSKQDKIAWAKNKASELEKKIKDHLMNSMSNPERIKALTSHYRIAGIYHYSWNNAMLIMCQGGTIAMSVTRWKDMGRDVINWGNKIYIYVPMIYTKKEVKDGKEVEKKITYFNLRPVYDIKDTEGKPLEYEHNSDIKTDLNYESIKPLLSELVKKPILEEVTGTKRGYITKDKIVISSASNNVDKIKTLIHECAHALHGHLDSEDNREACEIEAEGTAYLVMGMLGIDYDMSIDYMRSYAENPMTISKVNFMNIMKYAEKIYKTLA